MMTKPILFSLYETNNLYQHLLKKFDCDPGEITFHTFPDGETSVNMTVEVNNRPVIFLAGLEQPNEKILPLLFAAETAKMLGASKIGLIAPYLPYMREDTQFHPGSGITAQYFASLLSRYIDWLMTIDPHLHRFSSLNQIYSTSTYLLHAIDPIADWILKNVTQPFLIGPDKESEQWVSGIAKKNSIPYVIMEKTRKGDQQVEITFPSLTEHKQRTPVLVDDIISSGKTMQEAIKHLKKMHMISPICIGVHAIFAGNAYQNLLQEGAAQVITCNTIQHVSNTIDVSMLIANNLRGI